MVLKLLYSRLKVQDCQNPTVVLELLGNNPKREYLVISKRTLKQLEDLKLLNTLNFLLLFMLI